MLTKVLVGCLWAPLSLPLSFFGSLLLLLQMGLGDQCPLLQLPGGLFHSGLWADIQRGLRRLRREV
jgi:hypothetical protein